MLGTAFLDDSADANQSQVFVAAGFYCIDTEWKRMRHLWRQVLKPHKISYYRATDCRNLTGEFAKLREKWGEDRARQISIRIRNQLTDVMDSNGLLIGFGLGINLKDFWTVDASPEARGNTQWMRECHDFKTYAFRAVFYRIASTVATELPGDNYVSFICDDSSHQSKIRRGYKRMKEKFPELGERMRALENRDDKRTPELQMADFMADEAREMVTRYLATEQKTAPPLMLKRAVYNVDCWNKHAMLKVLSGEAVGV